MISHTHVSMVWRRLHGFSGYGNLAWRFLWNGSLLLRDTGCHHSITSLRQSDQVCIIFQTIYHFYSLSLYSFLLKHTVQTPCPSIPPNLNRGYSSLCHTSNSVVFVAVVNQCTSSSSVQLQLVTIRYPPGRTSLLATMGYW